jgi:hypothetical protein
MERLEERIVASEENLSATCILHPDPAYQRKDDPAKASRFRLRKVDGKSGEEIIQTCQGGLCEHPGGELTP